MFGGLLGDVILKNKLKRLKSNPKIWADKIRNEASQRIIDLKAKLMEWDSKAELGLICDEDIHARETDVFELMRLNQYEQALMKQKSRIKWVVEVLPVGKDMSKAASWELVIERFYRRLSPWKSKALSVGGRLTLTKLVLSFLLVHYMPLFRAPLKITDLLEKIRRRFFGASRRMKGAYRGSVGKPFCLRSIKVVLGLVVFEQRIYRFLVNGGDTSMSKRMLYGIKLLVISMVCSFMLCDLDIEPSSLSLSSLPSCDLIMSMDYCGKESTLLIGITVTYRFKLSGLRYDNTRKLNLKIQIDANNHNDIRMASWLTSCDFDDVQQVYEMECCPERI
ncbi:hypothetical protein Tco_0209664 [Tanacetum coccineum]